MACFSIVLVIVSGFFAYRQWSNSNKIRRAEFIKEIIERLRFDKEMVKAMYMIEYDEFEAGYGKKNKKYKKSLKI